MKYTIEIKATIEEKRIITDEEFKEAAKDFLTDNVETGTVKITDENGKVVEVKK